MRGEANTNQDEAADMSKESIQEVVQKSLEDYFNDLGEQKPTNIYDMMVMTVEKPILDKRVLWHVIDDLCGVTAAGTADPLG